MTKSTASPVGEAASRRTVGAPTTSTVAGSGADSKSACWPGISRPTGAPGRPAGRPGRLDSAAGVPPGGFATGCGGPATVTVLVALPATPG